MSAELVTRGMTVRELIAHLQMQEQDLPVAVGCGCSGGWSTAAKTVRVAAGTATKHGACLMIGWGDER